MKKGVLLLFGIIFLSYKIQVFGAEEKVLFIHDLSLINEEGWLVDNFKKALDYSKIPYELRDISFLGIDELKGYSLILFATEMIWKLDSRTCDMIKEWVWNGGNIVVGIRGFNENLKEIFGIENSPLFIETRGLIFKEELFPGTKGLTLEEISWISSLDVRLGDGVKIIAESSNGVPLIWESSYGDGKVIYWNSCLLGYKGFRGFLIQSILKAQDIGVSLLANCGIIYIDDCSLPMYNMKKEPIYSQTGKTDTEFYLEDWLPGMIELQKKYGIKYTLANVFNYNAKTSPPFPMDEWNYGKIVIDGEEKRASPYLAHKFMEYGNEMGLHGYNHQSLVLEPLIINDITISKGWGKKENIVMALQEVRAQWIKDNLGEFPFTYVPPMNVYSKEGIDALGGSPSFLGGIYTKMGLKALHEVFPEIKVIGGLFWGDFEKGQAREFGKEPWNEKFYCIPRVTSGYIMTESGKLTTISFIGNFGVWSHFIHPDDIYDPYRSGPSDNWREDENGLYYHFDRYLRFVSTNYPWLRWVTAKDAYEALVDYERIKIESYDVKDTEIKLQFSGYPIYFMVRINDGRAIDMMRLSNCEAISTQNREGYNYLVFKATGESVTLPIISGEWVNNRPEIEILTPSKDIECKDGFMIEWYDSDPDDDAKINLYYDTDNSGYDGTLIVSRISENDENDKYYWDITNLPPGAYYIYAEINDGINKSEYSNYSQGRLIKQVETLDNIIVYPNPCFPNKGQIVYITNLPLDANNIVYIYDIAGELVRTLKEGEEIIKGEVSETAIWDVKNEKGESIASGVYIYLLKSDKGMKVGKIAIIR